MSIASDFKTLCHLALGPGRGSTLEERLENFYSRQAANYDSFRERLLSGREDLIRSIDFRPGDTWFDLGGGTGSNLQYLGGTLAQLKRVVVVDLAPSLLAIASQRAKERDWSNVETLRADVTTLKEKGVADVVTFSYSLTMIPDWFQAIERAEQLLRPGGVIGVVDFHVSRKHVRAGRARHPWWTRTFWPAWFAMDDVFLSPDHLPMLEQRFSPVQIEERRAKIPYLPIGRTPYYLFIGRKPA